VIVALQRHPCWSSREATLIYRGKSPATLTSCLLPSQFSKLRIFLSKIPTGRSSLLACLILLFFLIIRCCFSIHTPSPAIGPPKLSLRLGRFENFRQVFLASLFPKEGSSSRRFFIVSQNLSEYPRGAGFPATIVCIFLPSLALFFF